MLQFLRYKKKSSALKDLKYKVPICILYKRISLKNTIKLNQKPQTTTTTTKLIVQIGVWATNLRLWDITKLCAANAGPPALSCVVAAMAARAGHAPVRPLSCGCIWPTASPCRGAAPAARRPQGPAVAWRWPSRAARGRGPRGLRRRLWCRGECPRRAPVCPSATRWSCGSHSLLWCWAWPAAGSEAWGRASATPTSPGPASGCSCGPRRGFYPTASRLGPGWGTACSDTPCRNIWEARERRSDTKRPTPETLQASAGVMKNCPCKVAIGCPITR